MNLDDLKRQAAAQGGRVVETARGTWRGSNGVAMTEVIAFVVVENRNGFGALRQWARKRGTKELGILDIDAAMAAHPKLNGRPAAFLQMAADSLDMKDKYAVLLGWLED